MANLTSSEEYNKVPPLNVKQYRLMEMDGAGRTVELPEQGFQELPEQGVQELEHLVPAVELQAHQHSYRDEAWN